jgi:hypothetical protein
MPARSFDLFLSNGAGSRLLVMILLAVLTTFLCAAPRGQTTSELDVNATAEGQLLPCAPFAPVSAPTPTQNPFRDEWMPVDSLKLDTILDANQALGLLWSNSNQNISLCGSLGVLTTAAKQAVAKAPDWIKPQLDNVFRHLEAADQQNWAAIINTAVDPYVDEIAFSVATSSPAWLSSIYANPQMLVENAQQMYAADAQLNYVQINNYGTATAGGDYYSTTSYYKIDADSELVQVEVPRDIYYWYIVHPKITDEIPAYIDPAITESNTSHANNIASPPVGQFWRTFFYNVEEGTYPCLADTLVQMNTVFNRVGPANDAIHAIQWWINHTMGFTSNSERPHQPVRIYRKHIGRCGEYGDYTQAASRAALIPCTQIVSMSTDHVWNEFWEDGWVQWEPVNGYINIPLVYENGWGKVFGSVFENRSDGCLTSVTNRYSEGIATLNFLVTDSLNVPVDGARVFLAIYESGIRVDMVDFTTNQGILTLPIGENRHYYVRVSSPVGIYPPNAGTYVSIIDNSVAGEVYNFTLEIPAAFAAPDITSITAPTDPVNDWQIGVSFTVPHQVINGQVAWDDIAITGVTPHYYKELDAPGSLNLLMTDPDNYIFYDVAHSCSAFNVLQNAQNGSAVFNVPVGQDWYAFLDNKGHAANAQHVTGAMLYAHYGVGNDDQTAPAAALSLLPNSPNPFSAQTNIRFSLKDNGKVKICVYNLKGQKVKELQSESLKAGLNSVSWDGTDWHARPVGTGIYYYTITAGGQTLSRKLLLLR